MGEPFNSLESLSPNPPYSGIISNIIQCFVEWQDIPTPTRKGVSEDATITKSQGSDLHHEYPMDVSSRRAAVV